jgi:hypothetical protein
MVVAPLILCGIQAGIWIKSTSHARSLSEIQNRENKQPPNELAGVVGMLLLIVEGTALSIPGHDRTGD